MTLSKFFYNSKRLPKKLYLTKLQSVPIKGSYLGGEDPYSLDSTQPRTVTFPTWINTGYAKRMFGTERFNELLKRKILRKTEPRR